MMGFQYINNRRHKSSLIQMLKTLSLWFFIITVFGATNFRLNTQQTFRLNVGDSLISTLGLFKATLLQNQCMLNIQTFNGNNAYTKVGNYTSNNYTGNCNYLNITEGKVVTDNNSTWMYVGASYNLTTILTIDDWGIIRLIGTYQLPDFQNQVSQQFNVTTFSTPQKYIFPVTQKSVQFMDSFPTITNQRKWVYVTSFGQLDIQQADNAAIAVHYSFSSFKVNNSIIADFNGNTFPAAIFPNITFVPRCLQPRLYIDYKPPFTLVFDPFWPIATVYEQGRYKVAQVSFGHAYQPFAWQTPRRLFVRNEPGVCPPFTFEFRGNCITSCPYPYYHELRGQFGYCVITCEEYTPKNDTTRVCSCYSQYESPLISSQTITACPQNALSYPYGCYCNETDKYFDRKISLSCVSTCPQGTFANKGLCMQCPTHCLSCQLDNFYRGYLQCKACSEGYSVVTGKCYKTCSPGKGYSLVSGICQPCSDPNCLDCSQSVSVCKRCNLLHAVSNGACIKNCNSSSQLTFYDQMNAKCLPKDLSCSYAFSTFYKNEPMLKCVTCLTGVYLHKNVCVDRCPTNFTANANNYCVCSINGTITVDDKCMAIPVCPIRMGWDPPSQSCLSCNFGCLTCYDNVCTSCQPGYFLYVAPQGVFCRRKSPLYTCDQQYGWINGVCLLKLFSDSRYRLTNCLAAVANCQACFPNSNQICVSCQTGFYNVNNTCISTCPNGTIPFQNLTCVYPEINNCSKPYLSVKYQPVILNEQKIDGSDPYNFYLFNGKELANDPVGYIPIFQNMTSRKTDGLFRDSQIFSPSWTCLKCNDGMGLTPDFLQCVPCVQPCLTCYMARNDSCLTKKGAVSTNCSLYLDYQTNTCVQNCSDQNKIPYVSNGILYCYPKDQAPTKSVVTIDSSTYKAADGSTYVFFVMDKDSQNTNQVTMPIYKQSSSPRVASGGNVRVGANAENVKLNNGYMFLKDNDPNNELWILNATDNLQKVANSENVALSNTVYGVSSQQGHNQFMKTWLAYIGYIMGIVLICLHAVFIGNDLLYKVDNTLILAQSIYFFSFVQLLVGKLLAQFYYGWLFAQFGFFPNFFQNTIPSGYIELEAPNSYKLATVDANIVRNAGWAFSLLLVFIGAYGIITFACWVLDAIFNRYQAWHPRIAVNALIGGIQFLSFPIFYWAVANLLYIGNSQVMSGSFNRTSKAVSICMIILIAIYGTVRWFFNPLGGLYMYKRIIIATILAASYLDNRMLAPLCVLEFVFLVFRFIMEKPQKNKFLWMMIFQSLLHLAAYLLMFLSLDPGVNTIIISIIIFVLIVILSYSLTNIYLESQNEWLVEDADEESQKSMAPAQRKSYLDNKY